VSGDAIFASGREKNRESDDKVRLGRADIEARMSITGRWGEGIAISGSTTRGEPVPVKAFSRDSTTTGILDWR
jgi:hypothetical protein